LEKQNWTPIQRMATEQVESFLLRTERSLVAQMYGPRDFDVDLPGGLKLHVKPMPMATDELLREEIKKVLYERWLDE